MKAELMGMSMKEREQMTINLWKSGKTEKEIAQEFDCSCSTVRRYLYEEQEYNNMESDSKTLRQLTYALQTGFEWKWPATCNRLLRAAGKKEQPVPEHSRQAEIEYWKCRERRA